ncbi:hypothetical protein FGB62_20g12 [Gracilaria domingensis]|nr:hypothetical protein FGB62_20g12 [Gracilaria domingensis]
MLPSGHASQLSDPSLETVPGGQFMHRSENACASRAHGTPVLPVRPGHPVAALGAKHTVAVRVHAARQRQLSAASAALVCGPHLASRARALAGQVSVRPQESVSPWVRAAWAAHAADDGLDGVVAVAAACGATDGLPVHHHRLLVSQTAGVGSNAQRPRIIRRGALRTGLAPLRALFGRYGGVRTRRALRGVSLGAEESRATLLAKRNVQRVPKRDARPRRAEPSLRQEPIVSHAARFRHAFLEHSGTRRAPERKPWRSSGPSRTLVAALRPQVEAVIGRTTPTIPTVCLTESLGAGVADAATEMRVVFVCGESRWTASTRGGGYAWEIHDKSPNRAGWTAVRARLADPRGPVLQRNGSIRTDCRSRRQNGKREGK